MWDVVLSAHQVSWPLHFQEFSSLFLPSHHRSIGIIGTCYHIQPFMGSGSSDSGPPTCVANIKRAYPTTLRIIVERHQEMQGLDMARMNEVL